TGPCWPRRRSGWSSSSSPASAAASAPPTACSTTGRPTPSLSPRASVCSLRRPCTASSATRRGRRPRSRSISPGPTTAAPTSAPGGACNPACSWSGPTTPAGRSSPSCRSSPACAFDMTDAPATFLLFVYGTLKRGGPRHHVLRGQRFVRAAVTRPKYLLFDLGAYPGLVVAEKDGRAVHGELYEVERRLIPRLDRIEGAPELYRLEPVEVE